MSFLNKFGTNGTVSIEELEVQFEATEEATAEEEAELEEAEEQANLAREEAEQSIEESETAERVVEELETQNEAIANIREQNNGVLPQEAAAGFEAARRMAAIAVGENPDEGDGAELVDEPGLESMVNGATLSLEEDKNKSMIQKIKDGIKKAWEWVKDKFNSFVTWLSKITNIIPKVLKERYNKIKALSDDEVAAGLAKLSEDKLNKYNAIILDGKLVDLAKLTDMANKTTSVILGNITRLTASFKGLVTKIFGKSSVIEQDDFFDSEYIKVINKTGKTEFKGAGILATLSANDKVINVDFTALEADVSVLRKVSKADILNGLNVGAMAVSKVKKNAEHLSSEMKKIEAFHKETINATDRANALSSIGKMNRTLFGPIHYCSVVNQKTLNAIKLFGAFADDIAKAAAKKEKPAA